MIIRIPMGMYLLAIIYVEIWELKNEVLKRPGNEKLYLEYYTKENTIHFKKTYL